MAFFDRKDFFKMRKDSFIKLREIKTRLRIISAQIGNKEIDDLAEELFGIELVETIDVIVVDSIPELISVLHKKET